MFVTVGIKRRKCQSVFLGYRALLSPAGAFSPMAMIPCLAGVEDRLGTICFAQLMLYYAIIASSAKVEDR